MSFWGGGGGGGEKNTLWVYSGIENVLTSAQWLLGQR